MPEISIIVPVYNVKQYLPAALDSLRAQTCPDWEAILVDDGSTKEEWKMVVETKKIMGDPAIEVAATCVRVPVLRRHGEAINVEFADEVTVEAARAALEAAPGVEARDDTANKAYPMPGLLAGTDGTFVGRLRKDPTVPHGIAFWDVADQIRKGAALNAVQIAQLLLP